VDLQASDEVVHVDRLKTWTAAVFASLRPRDHHVTDDEIFESLRAGNDEEAAAELLAAKGITVPMYCVWKTKYRHLSLEELRDARRRERRRAHCRTGALIAIAVLGAGSIVFALAREIADLKVRATSSATKFSERRPSEMGAERVPATTSAAAAARKPPVERQPAPDEAPATFEAGYKIQVAAAPSVQDARAFVDRLGSMGYPAYVSKADVSGAEVFRVRLGPFDSVESAEEVAAQLKQDGFSGAWIARER
jgi:cell division septation protein DedD